jgi:hypothetical protein
MKVIGTVPRSLDTPTVVRELMAAVATWVPEERDVRGFLRRACLATPAQARSGLRRIGAGIDTFASALRGPACGSTRKQRPGQTNRAGSSRKANGGKLGGKSK